MQKQELLDELRQLLDNGEVSKGDVESVLSEPRSAIPHHSKLVQHLNITQVLYILGAAIVVLGIGTLVGQNWDALSSVSKVVVTLGLGLACYSSGIILGRNDRYWGIEQAFYLISAITIPLGLVVVFEGAGISTATTGMQTLISGILLALYGVSLYAFRKPIFAILSIIAATWLYFSVLFWMLESASFNPDFGFSVINYGVLTAGVAYLALGHLAERTKSILYGVRSLLDFFGINMALGAMLTLGGLSPNQNWFWELIFPVICFASMIYSTKIHKRIYLSWGALYIIFYVLKITSEYFAGSLGWPVALVFAGGTIIGVAYFSINLKNQYYGVTNP